MHGRVGTESCVAVKTSTRQCGNSDVFGKESNIDCKRCFVGTVQQFSTKSQICLSADSLCVYPPYTMLLNVTEEVRRAHITSGGTVVAYLSVSFSLPGGESSPRLQRRPLEGLTLYKQFTEA